MPPRESPDTIRDLLQGFNSFQMQLGLMPGQGGGGFAGIQTPPMKHPGQVAQEMSMQIAQQSAQTASAAHTARQMVAPNALPMTAMAAVSAPPLPPAISQFGQDFGNRMNQIQQQYLSPWAAQGLSGITGQQGFGNMPSPIMMTPPHMGIYRPPMGPPPTPFLARERPMFPTPMTPMIPPPMFQTPFEQRYQEGVTADETNFGYAMAGLGAAGRVGAGLGAMGIGGAMGRGLMGRIGLPQFGRLGRMGGMIGGAALGFGALGGLAEQGVAGLLEPSVQARTLGQQVEVASRNFVVSGPQLNELGRGLSTRAGIGTVNRMQDMIQGGQIQGFNIRDMTRMTAQAGSMGMLDMAQSGEQIAQTMKNLARNLQVFMRLAQEPDVTRAMQQMATMRSMGLTIPETTMAMQNAYQFAKQAGTTTRGLMQTAGMPGAMTFQQLGMTAGLGMQVGMGAAGMARQAVAGGAFTPGQLAMAGGVQGIGQSLTEAAGASLGVNFQTMAMLTRNAQGELAVDPRRLRNLMSGRYSLQQQAEMGADNVARLGGERAITEMHTRINELRDQVGRSLGPQGSAMLLIRNALSTQQALGGANVMSLGGALQMIAPNMSQNQIRSMELMARSPQFWRNMEQWQERRIGELRDMEGRRREAVESEGGISGALKRAWGTPMDDVMSHVSAARRSISQWMTSRERRARALERGERFVDTQEDDVWRNAPGARRAEQAQEQFVRGGGFRRYMQQYGGEMTRGGSVLGGGTTAGQYAGALYNVANNVFAMGMLPRAYGTEENTMLAQARAEGGIGGWFAEATPNLYTMVAGPAGQASRVASQRRMFEQLGAGRLAQQATGLSGGEASRLSSQNTRTLNEFIKKTGRGETNALRDNLLNEIKNVYASKSRRLGKDVAVDQGELRQALQRAGEKSGLTADQAAQLANGKYRDAYIAEAIRTAELEGNPKIAGAIAASKTAASDLSGRASADQMSGTLEQIRAVGAKKDEELGLKFGVERSFFWGVSVTKFSEEERETFKNTLVQNDPLRMLAASAYALEKGGRAEEATKLRDQIKKQLAKEGRSQEYMDVLSAGKGMAADEKTQKIMRSFGGAMALRPDAVKAVQEAQGGAMARRGLTDMMAGAAELSKAGVTALEGMTGKEITGTELEGRMRSMLGSERQRKAAGGELVRAAEAATAEKLSPEERAKKLDVVRALLMKRGGGRQGGITVGGKGAGGAEEQEAQGTLEEIRSMAKQAMDQGGQGAEAALAAAIPTFAEGATAMKEAAQNFKDGIEAMKLESRMSK